MSLLGINNASPFVLLMMAIILLIYAIGLITIALRGLYIVCAYIIKAISKSA